MAENEEKKLPDPPPINPEIVRPFPEALDGQEWEIERSGSPAADTKKHIIRAPLVDHPAAESLRLMSLGRAKWINPEVTSSATPETVEACRKAYVQLRLRNAGIELDSSLITPNTVMAAELMAEIGVFDYLEAARIRVSTLYSPEFEFGQLIPDVTGIMSDGNGGFYWDQGYLDEGIDSFLIAHGPERLAELIEQKIEELEQQMADAAAEGEGESEGEMQPGDGEGEGESQGSAKEGRDWGNDSWDNSEWDKRVQESVEELKKGGRYHSPYSHRETGYWKPNGQKGGQWGRMIIEKVDCPLPLPAKLAYRGPRADDIGVAFRYPHRYCIDGKVFARRRKKLGGGSVLIDCSGSMSLTGDDIYNIVKAMPAAQIALYKGHNHSGVGWLRIVAAKKRRARKDLIHNFHEVHGNNLIDGPALYWLGKQPGPRYWVSDGQVTNAHEGFTNEAIDETAELLQKFRIVRVNNSKSVVYDYRDRFDTFYGKKSKEVGEVR